MNPWDAQSCPPQRSSKAKSARNGLGNRHCAQSIRPRRLAIATVGWTVRLRRAISDYDKSARAPAGAGTFLRIPTHGSFLARAPGHFGRRMRDWMDRAASRHGRRRADTGNFAEDALGAMRPGWLGVARRPDKLPQRLHCVPVTLLLTLHSSGAANASSASSSRTRVRRPPPRPRRRP